MLLDHLDQLPAGARQEILRRLNRLQDGREVRVALESARLAPRGLPSARPGKPFPTRGRFVVVPVPPLRERRADIPGLLNRFFQRHAGGHPLPILSSEALAFLMHYEFPNNLHDLDRIARALAEIPVEGAVSEGTIRALLGEAETPVGRVEGDLPTLAQAECNLLRAALDQARGNKSEAARRLGIPRARLARLIVKHGLGG